MRLLKNLHNIYLEIINTPFYRNGANGDRYILASLSRLIALSYQFDSANYALKQAHRLYKSKDSDEILSQYQLQNCIISYCGCYDTLLQVIYFAFKFGEQLNDKNDFTNVTKKCRWRVDGNPSHLSLRDNLNRLVQNDKITALINKLDCFMDKSRLQVAVLANHLKHGGGLITPKYATYISPIGYINERFTIEKNGEFININIPDKTSSFKANWFYPHVIDIPTIINQMYQQNEYIYNAVVDVYQSLEYDKLNLLNDLFKDKYSNPLIEYGTEQTK